VRDAKGGVCKIVEQKDATDEERLIREVNSGIYCMDLGFLREHIGKIGSNNAQKEYYLTDLLEMAVSEQLPCCAVTASDSREILGVNDRAQLADAGAVLRQRINRNLMLEGVTIVDPLQTYIDVTVQIGSDSVVWPGVCLRGATVIGQGCVIEMNVQVTDSSIGDQVVLKTGSVISESRVASHVAIGPMAHLRPGSVLGEHVKIGNFVETKKVVMSAGAKASHLTYLGDAEIGRDVNIGCGTITCNYDGKNKHKTVIEDDVFIGSDVQLVAPVRVGRNSLVAAGTTVTVDVPPDSLAIARTPQVNKEGWRLKKGS
jgi:bifunctional UDP-N-acetylglucosamine pyrophosphorylase/glucosamine-1-phosphate N-acetyltransferase